MISSFGIVFRAIAKFSPLASTLVAYSSNGVEAKLMTICALVCFRRWSFSSFSILDFCFVLVSYPSEEESDMALETSGDENSRRGNQFGNHARILKLLFVHSK